MPAARARPTPRSCLWIPCPDQREYPIAVPCQPGGKGIHWPRNGFLLGRDKIDPTGQDREFTFGKGMDFENGAPNTGYAQGSQNFQVRRFFEFLHVHHEASDFEIEEQVG